MASLGPANLIQPLHFLSGNPVHPGCKGVSSERLLSDYIMCREAIGLARS